MTAHRRFAVLSADPELRQAIREILAAEGLPVVAQGSSPEDLDGATGIDLAVVHELAEEANRFEASRAVKERAPEAAVIAVWPFEEPGDARRALRAGVDGIVNQSALVETLLPTVVAVLSGVACIPQTMRAPLQAESLSSREKQMLGLVVRGYSNAEIASRLYLAESTVKSHLSSAYAKLGVRSRKDAATLILDPREGLGPGILAISAA